MNDAYTDLSNLANKQGADYKNVQIQIPGGASTFFRVTFDSRGQLGAGCVPASCQVQVRSPGGVATLTVSQVGGVKVVKQ